MTVGMLLATILLVLTFSGVLSGASPAGASSISVAMAMPDRNGTYAGRLCRGAPDV